MWPSVVAAGHRVRRRSRGAGQSMSGALNHDGRQTRFICLPRPVPIRLSWPTRIAANSGPRVGVSKAAIVHALLLADHPEVSAYRRKSSSACTRLPATEPAA